MGVAHSAPAAQANRDSGSRRVEVLTAIEAIQYGPHFVDTSSSPADVTNSAWERCQPSYVVLRYEGQLPNLVMSWPVVAT